MTHSVKSKKGRDEFFKAINSNENAIDKYFPINIKTRLNSFVRKALSVTGLYSSIKSIAKKLLRK